VYTEDTTGISAPTTGASAPTQASAPVAPAAATGGFSNGNNLPDFYSYLLLLCALGA
jgi:hypothetical protein